MPISTNAEFFLPLIAKHSNDKDEVNFHALMDELRASSFSTLMKTQGINAMASMAKGMPKHIVDKMLKKHNENDVLDTDFKAQISSDPMAEAFVEKSFAHSGGGATMVPPPINPLASDLLSYVKRTTSSAAYINVPFCQTRCAFCMFYIAPYKKEESQRYTDAVIKEMQLWADRPAQNSAPIQALYLGGGTPTALEASDLKRIIEKAREYLPLANDVELTVEGRLSYFDDHKMEACLEAGANRFSLGVQTFDTEIRQALGRISPKDSLISRLEKLCSYNEAAVVIDLIFGLPGQTNQNFKTDLEIVSSLPIHGVDLYQLIMLENSPLEKIKRTGRDLKLPTKEQRARLYEQGCKFLQEHHWHQLSVSHFARTPRERNIYNVLAKSDADTLAFGPGAGGKIQGVSFVNGRDYEDYFKKLKDSQKPVAMIFMPPKNWRLYKNLGEMLELGFIDRYVIKKKYNLDILNLANEVFMQWQEAGLLNITDRYINLTQAGLFWSVTMSQLLQNYLIKNQNHL